MSRQGAAAAAPVTNRELEHESQSEIRALDDAEIEAVSGGFYASLDLGFVRVNVGINGDGASISVRVGNGPSHTGAVYWDDLPK